ncbi:ammonium transporter AmtB [Xenorhabdus szentirmaii]|uniref:Ammonium transporter n=2 Tax=Xenorhabdus szentirmaii TaxID=290112 RepID=W1J1A8_9GAMM|nr:MULTISPECIES: ammonium transporter AmtB [Xenorhabdus]MBD2779487.1 ammonium transporter AmtB [Xenorhabdus sp. 38]MBD2790987.1 ammonium transporter AmtB [Xenorhabdus sp. CUL]MBD2799158.1 ammonium transporter AmtB [Xenorhabdus sp. M]MBD2820189.1 ammonium transporter AmtB [Xenorhabdus sp. 42]MBD2825207.1 ammonium transporter AmtB [Xenorhabdus sp. 5]
MKKLFLSIIGSVISLPSFAFAAEKTADKADTVFMFINTVLVLFMTIPGIALFYGGLLRRKNVLSLMSQVFVSFSLVCVLWIVYGYSMTFDAGNPFWGGLGHVMLKGISITDLNGSFYQLIYVVFQGAFACITVALVVGALCERIRFSALLIFSVLWLTISYIPMAHMIWGGGFLAQDGALDFAGGTVVHINAAVAGLIGAYLLGKRSGFGREAFKPHNLPMTFIGTAILYIGWFGFNVGSAGAVNAISALALLNTVVATAGAVLSWIFAEWIFRQKPSLLGACSGCISGLVVITPAAATVGTGGALIMGGIAGIAGLWGVVILKRWLRVDDVCDVFGVHGVCGIIGCLLTGIFTSSVLGGVGFPEGMTMLKQFGIQAISVLVCIVWSSLAAYISFKVADKLVGLRMSVESEREGLDITSHGESAYN